MDNRPKGRQKNVTGQGKDIYKRGQGLGTGPVGNQSGYSGRPGTTSANQQQSGGTVHRASSGRGSMIGLIIAAVVLLGGGGGALGGLFGGGDTADYTQDYSSSYVESTPVQQSSGTQSLSGSTGTTNSGGATASSGTLSPDLAALLGGSMPASLGNVSSGWSEPEAAPATETTQPEPTVTSGARAKRTNILGSGKDVVTLMVYMCGTDLESKYGMGTSDLQEMAAATIGQNVNIIVYTGGCKSWRNSVLSSSVNQIYKVESGGLRCLVKDDGSKAMTKPSTLSGFIQYCTKNYPANRNMLIFWDHGGGSLSGYGYDEKYASSGSMTLKGIDQALKDGGATFDFIGFDACLMATLETDLVLANYADYVIASEETEPGVGWYYTNWVTALSKNTSISTLDLGKQIVDDFVSVCNQKCPGQKTTLSVVDLAELEYTVPDQLKAFAQSTSELLQSDGYQTVSRARSGAREFASSNKIDQVDLVHLANNMGTAEGKALSKALLGAVKYNRTSSSITNAYGISIYFPYQRTSKVDNAVAEYDAIGMDSDYMRCIQQFASLEVSGQAVSGGASSPLGSLFGGSYGGTADSDMISQVLSGLLGGNFGGVSGLTSGNSGFLGRSLDTDEAISFISDNQFDASALVWSTSEGRKIMRLSEKQWSMVNDLELNVFYDDGEGYIDLGLDNAFSFTSDGALLGDYDGTWLAIDDQPIAYYHTGTVYDGDNYTITGRVPVMLNGERAELILVFDNAHPYGYIAGARMDYHEGETETVAKAMVELEDGDKIDFICDYYAYDGTYLDSYYLGEQYIYNGQPTISNVYINADRASATYRFTDIYNQTYWSPVM